MKRYTRNSLKDNLKKSYSISTILVPNSVAIFPVYASPKIKSVNICKVITSD